MTSIISSTRSSVERLNPVLQKISVSSRSSLDQLAPALQHASSSSRSSSDRLTPVSRSQRHTAPAGRPFPYTDEMWPEDQSQQGHDVGGGEKMKDVYTAPPGRKFGGVKARRSIAGTNGCTATRQESYRVQRKGSSVFVRKDQNLKRAQTRRSITEMQRDVFTEADGENSCYSMAATVVEERRVRGDGFGKEDMYEKGDFLYGYCRMAWFARLRCTRFLRLVQGTLHCFDSGLRKRLWAVQLQGARVRVHHLQNKIVLSKLAVGHPIEFFLFDAKSCRVWGAALLRASTPRWEDRRMPKFKERAGECDRGEFDL